MVGVRTVRAVTSGVGAWLTAGAVGAVLLVLVLGKWSNGFAVSGLILVLGSLGWALGPFKTPMAWSEGALLAYQPNADAAPSIGSREHRRVLAVPAFAFTAGVMLLAIALAIAVA